MFNRKTHVAVLGAGNGGLALAAYLSQHGHQVALWNRSPERIAPIETAGGIWLSQAGGAATLVPLEITTSSIAVALFSSEIVLVAVPASGHADVARQCARYLEDGQVVLLMPGRTGGALEFRRVLRRAGCRARILLGETNTFPFAARCVGPASAVIHGIKTEVLAAALPARQTSELLDACGPCLPMLAAAPSVLHTGLGNIGAILHPVIHLLNADRIRRGDVFDFYADGVTRQVAGVLAAADAERVNIARAYGVDACPLRDWVASAYGHRGATIQEAVAGNPAYAGIKAPKTIEHRYLLEDVPTGLVPLMELGWAAGVASPTLRALADLGKRALGGRPWAQPRSLNALGLADMDVTTICDFVKRGRETRRAIRATRPRIALAS